MLQQQYLFSSTGRSKPAWIVGLAPFKWGRVVPAAADEVVSPVLMVASLLLMFRVSARSGPHSCSQSTNMHHKLRSMLYVLVAYVVVDKIAEIL